MTQYPYTKVANLDTLTTQIMAASLPLDHLTLDAPDQLVVFTTRDLTSGEQTSLTTVVTNHTINSAAITVAASLLRATNFGIVIINNYKVQNVLGGITQSGQTQTIANALMNLNYYLGTGSLYAAIAEIGNLRASSSLSSWSPWITDALLHTTLNQIQTYLGIALT